MRGFALAASMADAAELGRFWGPGTVIGIGGGQILDADVLAPGQGFLTAAEIAPALQAGHPQYVLGTGNRAVPAAAQMAPVIETLIHATGAGFMAICLAAPYAGRTVYQGHLFAQGRLARNMLTAFGEALDARVGLVAHDVTAAGAAAISQRLAALKEQGYGLALVDAVLPAECDAVAEAFAAQKLIGGPAWVSPRAAQAEPAAPGGRVVILSGALDRQSLFQVSTAARVLPLLHLNFNKADVITEALAWAADHTGGPCMISASTTPDQLHKTANVPEQLGKIAQGLVAAGTSRLVIAGSDTAAAIIAALGLTRLTAGAACGELRWLECKNIAILIKPGGIGGRDLFLDHFEPQIRLNAAAE